MNMCVNVRMSVSYKYMLIKINTSMCPNTTPWRHMGECRYIYTHF